LFSSPNFNREIGPRRTNGKTWHEMYHAHVCVCVCVRGDEKYIYIIFWLRPLGGDFGVDGRIILEWILEEQGVRLPNSDEHLMYMRTRYILTSWSTVSYSQRPWTVEFINIIVIITHHRFPFS
jgi:hypothetical protein